MPSSKENQQPADSRTLGGVTVSIFANRVKGRDTLLYKVSTKRTYVQNGQYVSVTSLFHGDLQKDRALKQWAYQRIFELMQAERKKLGEEQQSAKEAANEVASDETHAEAHDGAIEDSLA